MSKKFLSILFAALLLLTLTACGNNGAKPENGSTTENVNKTEDSNTMPAGFVFEGNGSQEATVPLGTPSRKLNPEEVYSKLTYTPEMFYGQYSLKGGKNVEKDFAEKSQYFSLNYKGEELELSLLPYEIRTGKYTFPHMVNHIKEHNWMELNFARRINGKNEYIYSLIFSYEIEGNKLILTLLESFNVDKENNKISYTLSDTILEYTFSFSGRNLTLSSGGNSVTLTTGLDAYSERDYVHADGYLSPGSNSAHGIDKIVFRYDSEDKDSYLYFKMQDGESSYNSIAVLEENGLFTFTLSLEDSKETYQYVCFVCDDDGLVLTDGVNTYYYNDTYSDRHQLALQSFITEDQSAKLENLSDYQLGVIVEKKENLLEDLVAAFNDAGINVSVDVVSGEMAVDSSILFGGDSSVLTDDGKMFLNKFINVYTSVIFSEKYEGFVEKTMVEGHTAPVGGSTYESGLPLSVERADNVKTYCISSETGVDTNKLAANLEAVGYSNSKPVKDENGNVDMAASRRVSFRFIINLEVQ